MSKEWIPLILEVAILDIKPGTSADFENAFSCAEEIITHAEGYMSHDLLHCVEKLDRYILLVRWERLENHTEGFRKSPEYQDWKRLLHNFYDPFPTVEHFIPISQLK